MKSSCSSGGRVAVRPVDDRGEPAAINSAAPGAYSYSDGEARSPLGIVVADGVKLRRLEGHRLDVGHGGDAMDGAHCGAKLNCRPAPASKGRGAAAPRGRISYF